VQHCWDDAGRAIGGRGDDAATGGVFLVHRQRVQVHPVQHLQRVAQRGLGVAGQVAMQRVRTALDLEATGQRARGSAAALDAVLHHLPDLQQAGVDVGVAAPVLFVCAHHLRDAATLALRDAQQVVAAMKGQRQHGGVGCHHLELAAVGCDLVTDHEATAHRVVHARRDFAAAAGA
jgi:hypothetical protein